MLPVPAAMQVQSLAWKLPYATGVAQKQKYLIFTLFDLSVVSHLSVDHKFHKVDCSYLLACPRHMACICHSVII